MTDDFRSSTAAYIPFFSTPWRCLGVINPRRGLINQEGADLMIALFAAVDQFGL